MHARVIVKGTAADAAAAAAFHGIRLTRAFLAHTDPAPETHAEARQRKNVRADMLHARLAEWFTAPPAHAPFPPGTLLHFSMREGD